MAPAFFAIVLIWGGTGWAFPPAQSSYLLSLSPGNAPLVLSLNASALYLGIAGGSLVAGPGAAIWHGQRPRLGRRAVPCAVAAWHGRSALLRQPDPDLVRQG